MSSLREAAANLIVNCSCKGALEVCDICKGARKVVLRFESDDKLDIKEREVFDMVCDVIREDNNG